MGTALWTWDTSGSQPVLTGFSNNAPTKTGLLPDDLQQAAGIPLQYYAPAGVTVNPVPPDQLITWIRDAEDWVEQQTNILLCPTWIASPPELQAISTQVTGVPAVNGLNQQLGLDYDLGDAAYDFVFERFKDEGWGAQPLRYRPLRIVNASTTNFTAVKNISAIYPLLNQFFKVPPTWVVEDEDFGLIRMVPAENVQMLPLYAMQIAMMGFAESIPGAWHYQYTAGLTDIDYSTRFRFIKRLVLCDAVMRALVSIQSTMNMGMMRVETLIDGLQTKLQYSEKGPLGSSIEAFKRERDELLETALSRVFGPSFLAW